MLKSVTAADRGRLGSAEKFLLQLMEVQGYALRIEAMLLKEELETCVGNLESSINAILQASQGIPWTLPIPLPFELTPSRV